jgi:hypothetical protein
MITFLRSQTNFINHRLTITKSAQYKYLTLGTWRDLGRSQFDHINLLITLSVM